MPELPEIQSKLQQLRDERDGTRASLQGDYAALRLIEIALDQARRRAGEDKHGQARVEELEGALRAAEARLEENRKVLIGRKEAALGNLAELFSPLPKTLIEQVNDATPILLLPVRIETRFVAVDNGTELRVRIFPDDIAITAHEKSLTEAERLAGEDYWRERARAGRLPTAEEKQAAHRGAWTLLATRHGAPRASWIARQTRPRNWDQQPAPEKLEFPIPQSVATDQSPAPRSRAMPDRFVVMAFAGGEKVHEAPGRHIPDDLTPGPDPQQLEGFLDRDPATGRLIVDPDLRWLVDFDRAVEVGMALRIPLTPEQARDGFERLVVLGLRLSTNAEQSRALIEDLIESQRYSRGFSILPQGTPTNNTDQAASGFSTSAAAIEEAFLADCDEPFIPEPDHFKKSDGQRLAEAIGLSFDMLRTLPNAGRRDIAEALAMNRALWPATMGAFLREMMSSLISEDNARRLRDYFLTYVTGRTQLPAIRAGAQPYGVLLTSAFSKWKWSERELGDDQAFWQQTGDELTKLWEKWNQLRRLLSHAGRADGGFQHLLSIIGLQASSVEFYQRKAVSDEYIWNYLNFKGASNAFARTWRESLQNRKTADLRTLRINPLPVPEQPFGIKDITFMREHSLLTGPVIDGDPKLPLSETSPITPFDGTHNYIEWLMTSDKARIVSESFTGGDGNAVAPPRALLYQLLRHAWLAELESAGKFFLLNIAARYFDEFPLEPAILNVGEERSLTASDFLNVDAAKIGVTRESRSVGDYLVAHARAATAVVERPIETLPLVELHDALATLSKLPTARLERLFAEHLDLCSYRLDAWITGLFQRRLRFLRGGQMGNTSIMLGAYGWVEHLKPDASARRVVPAEELPEDLRDEPGGPVIERESNGGFILAPSLTQGATAAVLRNAYLSHSDRTRPEAMSVNLSSRRVRAALFYLEGIRNGQDLAALLGYQLERGLHENHPGVELDEFIYILRERFPLISKKLTPVPDGKAAEVIEARNVVNGYDLLEYVRGKTYPFGIAGLPADPTRAGAITSEIDALKDALDAIGDLLLAESVHQVVQGNTDRARGSLQAITEGEPPPQPEVIETPRSGRGITHRVLLHLNDGDGWLPTPSPRAAANHWLNHWLKEELPGPETIQWKASRYDWPDRFVSLGDLDLEPLDVVLMTGEQSGNLSSELERYLVYRYKRDHGIADDEIPFFYEKNNPDIPDDRAILFHPDQAENGKHAFDSLLPLLRALRRIVMECRPLHALDFMPSTEAQRPDLVDMANPKGYDNVGDLKEFKDRIEAAHLALKTLTDGLKTFYEANVKPLYDALKSDPVRVIAPQWSAHLDRLRNDLLAICRFGIPEALPASGVDVSETIIDVLVAQTAAVLSLLGKRLEQARAKLDLAFTDPLPADPAEAAREKARRIEARIASYTEAARLLLGKSFTPLPLFKLATNQQPELAAATAQPVVTDPLAVEEWLQPLTRVRPRMESLGRVATYHEWLKPAPLVLQPVQLPHRPGDGWVGGEISETMPPGDYVSLSLWNRPANLSDARCGLLVDEWTEVIPTENETAGIAFHFNRPNAVAPQALLLAIAPELRGAWRWDDLVAVVNETLDRAQLRAVEPDFVAATEYFQILPTILAEFSKRGLLKSTNFAMNAVVRAPLPT
jgi:hypothetical protein